MLNVIGNSILINEAAAMMLPRS